MFADQAELQAYTNHVLDKHALRPPHIRVNAEVTEARWTEDAWTVYTADGREFRGKYLINASGPLSTPVIPPDFAGRELFTGKSFHTNDWDHSFDYRASVSR